jgi:hypothetical protein
MSGRREHDVLSIIAPYIGKVRSLVRPRVFTIVTAGALIAFESFNYGTTEFALTDLLGELSFASVRWATILALAFCAIDFAGIGKLFGPQRDGKLAMETWYLLGAWFLAATMNAGLTWWSVSLALLQHPTLGNELLGRDALLAGVPLFVAAMVWLIRVLLIGSFTLTGSRTQPAVSHLPEQAFLRRRTNGRISVPNAANR